VSKVRRLKASFIELLLVGRNLGLWQVLYTILKAMVTHLRIDSKFCLRTLVLLCADIPDESIDVARDSLEPNLCFSRIVLADLPLLKELAADPQTWKLRLEKGDHCYVAFKERAPVGYCWGSQGPAEFESTDVRVYWILAARVGWDYDLFVTEEYRRQNIANGLRAVRVADERSRGLHRAFRVVEYDNFRSMIGSHASNWSRAAIITSVSLGKSTFLSIRARTQRIHSWSREQLLVALDADGNVQVSIQNAQAGVRAKS